MKISFHKQADKGFSLIETVIAIGVLAVLLSGFLVVFAPAASGIRKSLNNQDAGRLVATLEQELVTLRGNEAQDLGLGPDEVSTGFDKAFYYIKLSDGPNLDADDALLVYKYRADLQAAPRSDDGTFEPLVDVAGMVPGEDYVVKNMIRRLGDDEFYNDLEACEGPIYLVKCNQLLLQKDTDGERKLMLGPKGEINNVEISPTGNETLDPCDKPDDFSGAVITFKADFYSLPTKSRTYFDSPEFETLLQNASKPVFSRNLAVRR